MGVESLSRGGEAMLVRAIAIVANPIMNLSVCGLFMWLRALYFLRIERDRTPGKPQNRTKPD
uniref:Uncharacterized protein n=1 Tax=Desertifilum tharense IPPAS B-1220 TaxID=1781255 RepID=A0ACD5GXV1_9CYAN